MWLISWSIPILLTLHRLSQATPLLPDRTAISAVNFSTANLSTPNITSLNDFDNHTLQPTRYRADFELWLAYLNGQYPGYFFKMYAFRIKMIYAYGPWTTSNFEMTWASVVSVKKKAIAYYNPGVRIIVTTTTDLDIISPWPPEVDLQQALDLVHSHVRGPSPDDVIIDSARKNVDPFRPPGDVPENVVWNLNYQENDKFHRLIVSWVGMKSAWYRSNIEETTNATIVSPNVQTS